MKPIKAKLSPQLMIVRTDWAKVIEDLTRVGVSPYKISLILGCSDCAVRNWGRGGEPGHTLGEALLRLHVKLTSNTSTDVAVTQD